MTTVITQRDARGSLPTATRRAVCITWRDENGSHRHELTGLCIVGSSPEATVHIVDPRVSRLHAKIELDDAGVWVSDLGSTNGTWSGTIRVSRVHLHQSSELTVGATRISITFEMPATLTLWPDDRLGALLGQSVVMREVFATLIKCAKSRAAVVISGETGTGKELAARLIHDLSDRSEKPFVVIDCATVPESLFEAELFGYEKGAFTGAVDTRSGALEDADGGTVFLDEVGELPLSLQPKLLRVLENKTIRRVGQNSQRALDVRFIAASHRDLPTMVARGEFREDLFFRLSVLAVRMPALRERLDDIPVLLESMLGVSHQQLSEKTRKELNSRFWAGNVRELRVFCERVMALGVEPALSMLRGTSEAAQIQVERQGGLPSVDTTVPFKVLRETWVSHLEREYVGQLLSAHKRDSGKVAELAGLDRTYINRLIRKHRL